MTPERPHLTLDDLLVAAFEVAAVRGPGRWPQCPVCGGSMSVCEGVGSGLRLRCEVCGSELADSREGNDQLQLVA